MEIIYFVPPFKNLYDLYIVDAEGHRCFNWLREEGLTKEFKNKVIKAINNELIFNDPKWDMMGKFLTYDHKNYLEVSGWHYLTGTRFGDKMLSNSRAELVQYNLLLDFRNKLNETNNKPETSN